ncbi:hypothetical protein BUALT_Bualt14G0046700 [Buddleja alternifolia]|uniref:KIB1-4 beta-propeller domain-containing protein n=1 Tax=Buddleja alternifolia TaxID=168488 RepID=A0AAV6WLI9_9LAMI|nr:hypothetical protein BUALT_Bualt14G0046700 [Buddleja alternifolia]
MASPLLVLPLHEEEESQETNINLFNLKTKTSHKLINLPKNPKDLRFVGSSHGWLIVIDKNTNIPFLLNPFSETLIHLPTKNIPSTIIKAILSANPSSHKNYTVILIYEHGYNNTKLAFCRHGNEEWTYLEGEPETYYDIVCTDLNNNILLALGPGPLVEAWDLGVPIPKKKTLIQDSCPKTLLENENIFPNDLYTSQWYLALSFGQIFLVVRYIGEFVRYDGKVVYEGDTLTDYASEPLVCPYRTVDFKLDLENKNWIEVDCLDDFAMFLGGNQSMMLSTTIHRELKRNVIYFTDDYWDRMNEDYSYGGHDMGIYNMEYGIIDAINVDCQEQLQRIVPPPFWITLPD